MLILCSFFFGFWWSGIIFVGNCFLRILRFLGNFPAESAAENEDKSAANFPATNPKIISLKMPQKISQKTSLCR
jgi:hypothetical protein